MIRVQEFFDKATSTLTYAVWDPSSRDAVIIDPVLDYEPGASAVSEDSIKRVRDFLVQQGLHVHFLLETHAHADHLSGAQALKVYLPSAEIAIGARITDVQNAFRDIFDFPQDFKTDGSQFDRLLKDGEIFQAGTLSIKVFYTPGHTPACASYLIDDAVFTGDALFMPDGGVGRCDFPEGSAETLYESVTEKLYKLPETTRVFTAHDYQPGGRALRFESTIGEEKATNAHLKAGTTKDAFVKFRKERDKTLSAPKLLLPSIQVNVVAGRLPPPHRNGRRYLSIPINAL